MTTALDYDYRDQARFLAGYAKRYHAGAFATPLPKELPGATREFSDAGRTVIYTKTLRSLSARRDWTGVRHELPQGARVALVVARDPGSVIPDLVEYDRVFTYVEDTELTTELETRGWVRCFTQISAASEIKVCWGTPGSTPQQHSPADAATLTQVQVPFPSDIRDRIITQLQTVTHWHDDFPFYSDGSWSAVNLRGYRPDDPTWGIKPSEMPRKWQQEHPEAAGYTCDWTTLGRAFPAVREWVDSVQWWNGLERVRLLRMAGRGGEGGVLRRHTDITDRFAGTRDGHITRFHIPLVTDPRIVMHAWDLNGAERSVHLTPGRMYYLDARKPHAVTNPTGVDRVHLVVDVVADRAVRNHIAASSEVWV